METFTMIRKELPRAGLVKAALAGRITNHQAATALHLTVRQVQRLKRRFESGGAPALRHRSRGQRSPRRLPATLGASIAELMTTTDVGFNDVVSRNRPSRSCRRQSAGPGHDRPA